MSRCAQTTNIQSSMKTQFPRSTRRSSRTIALLIAVAFAALLAATTPSFAGLKITRTPIVGPGTDPPANLSGGGNIDDIFNQAADYWEKIYSDPNQTWNVELQYRWGFANSGEVTDNNLSAQFRLTAAGGEPRRILSGIVSFDNSGGTLWFADPDPSSNSAYADVAPAGSLYSVPSNPDGIFLNNGIWFVNPTNPDAVDHRDLLTIAMHEIGHGLGMLQDPPEFSGPFDFEITSAVSPHYAGLHVFLDSLGIFEHLPPPCLMMPRNEANIRQFPSTLDIMSMAQISEYNNPNWFPSLELIVKGLNVPPGQRIALFAKLQTSQARLRHGDCQAARNILNSFINQVEANPGDRLTVDQIDSLVAIAQTAIASIGNAPATDADPAALAAATCRAPCGAVSATMPPMTLMGLALMRHGIRRRLGRR